MDRIGFVIFTFLFLCCGCLPMQEPEQAAENPPTTTVINEVTITVTEPNVTPAAKNCSTAKGLEGTCVQRELCDHSTPAVDLTLYSPRGYLKSCSPAEVCCPFVALVRVAPTKQPAASDDDVFEFDEDD